MTRYRRTRLMAVVLLTGLMAGGLSRSLPARAQTTQIGSIQLSPQAITLQNAADTGAVAPPQQQIAVSLSVLDTNGNPIRSGSFSQPITVSVYGPPSQPLTAEQGSINSPTDPIYFDYSGAPVWNSIVVTAVAGSTFALMTFQPAHRGFDGSEDVTFTMPAAEDTMTNGWRFQASLGGGPIHEFLMDTGSIGVVVPASALGPGAVGPGAPGEIRYTRDGENFTTFHGHFYLTPLTLSVGGAQVSTVPIEVLGVDSDVCCLIGDLSGLGVMGVGFGRQEPEGLLPPELVNPFLALEPVILGSMHPGYTLRRESVTLGVTREGADGYNRVALQPSTMAPGDWQLQQGCFGFPSLPGYDELCGTMVVDTGISSMILGSLAEQRPPSLANGIEAGTAIRVMVPSASGEALSYGFTVGDGGAMTPTSVGWAMSWPFEPEQFVNTGRRLIADYDYLYDAGLGRVGFRASR